MGFRTISGWKGKGGNDWDGDSYDAVQRVVAIEEVDTLGLVPDKALRVGQALFSDEVV